MLEYKSKRKEETDENYTLTEDILFQKLHWKKNINSRFRSMTRSSDKFRWFWKNWNIREDDPDFWMQYYVPY
jgi:hypothetical protein